MFSVLVKKNYFIRSLPDLLLAWEGRGAGSSGGRNGRVRLLFIALSSVLMSKENLPSFFVKGNAMFLEMVFSI